ncbi:MAG TPA: sulfate ABC transporter permease subunit CysT [Fibrobacteria bacterium]|jgi:sulfate transport system permease protein|nr:sulfate ABC transporter permease subunit CysT [Fibrobacteria bacterium]
MALSIKKRSVLPGFGLTFGYTVFYLSLIVLIPLGALFLKTTSLTWPDFWATVTAPRVLASFRISFGGAFIAAFVNLFVGLLVAWVLARYEFRGKAVLDALVDLPFALPTAVAGIALTAVFSTNGWLGAPLERIGIKVAYTPLGIIVAMIFISLPFLVRTVQPVLEDLEKELEEASATLGATRWQTFRHVILPVLAPSLFTGFAMGFARALGEYGSIVFIAGNMPMKTEITPLLIITKLEQYQYAEATAIAAVTLVISFVLLFGINYVQWRSRRRYSL